MSGVVVKIFPDKIVTEINERDEPHRHEQLERIAIAGVVQVHGHCPLAGNHETDVLHNVRIYKLAYDCAARSPQPHKTAVGRLPEHPEDVNVHQLRNEECRYAACYDPLALPEYVGEHGIVDRTRHRRYFTG